LVLALVATAALVSSSPTLREFAQYRRSLVAEGELWRLVTMHLVHGWLRLALIDLGLLLLIGASLERRRRRVLVAALLAALLATPAVLWTLRPDLEQYQGASSLVHAALAALLLDGAIEAHGRARVAALVALAVLAIKLALELFVGAPFDVVGAPHDVETVAVAHAAGATAGVVGCCVARSFAARPKSADRPEALNSARSAT